MPKDKSPGLDGFNGLFFKKCWHIIKEVIYNLCKEFFEGNLNLKAINNSFITLIPKCNNPSSVNDFRPISLLNSVLKLLTKIMSRWLQRVIIPLVHQNQYGFIKNRTIQDCLAWAFEYIHQCQYSQKEIIIPKPHFEKVFDTITTGFRAFAVCPKHTAKAQKHKANIFAVRGSRRSSHDDQPRRQSRLRREPFIGHTTKPFAVC